MREWQSELSSIDTALLLAGVLTVRRCFETDAEVVQFADAMYRRVDFPWMLNGHPHIPRDGLAARGWLHRCAVEPLLRADAAVSARHRVSHSSNPRLILAGVASSLRWGSANSVRELARPAIRSPGTPTRGSISAGGGSARRRISTGGRTPSTRRTRTRRSVSACRLYSRTTQSTSGGFRRQTVKKDMSRGTDRRVTSASMALSFPPRRRVLSC